MERAYRFSEATDHGAHSGVKIDNQNINLQKEKGSWPSAKSSSGSSLIYLYDTIKPEKVNPLWDTLKARHSSLSHTIF